MCIRDSNYYTVVDRTQNEWSDWQLKNLNAIVWLYRGEVDKMCIRDRRMAAGTVKVERYSDTTAMPQTQNVTVDQPNQ